MSTLRPAGDLLKPIIWLPTWEVGTTLRSTSSIYQYLTGQTAFFSAERSGSNVLTTFVQNGEQDPMAV